MSRESPPLVVERVYDEARRGVSYRVLVDRLWPRGVTKVDAQIDEWMKDVAPTTELRRWYAHDPDRFAEFARRYRAELRRPDAARAVERLRSLSGESTVSLVTATRDVEHSAARVLHDHLQRSRARSRRPAPRAR